MSPRDIEEIEYSFELPIGIRLYYKNRLLEVIESEEDRLIPLFRVCIGYRLHG